MKRIMIVAASYLPIPAYKGGATETLMTELLDRLKDNADYQFDVYSFCEPEGDYKTKSGSVTYHYIKPSLKDNLYLQFFRCLRLLCFKKINIPSSFAKRLSHDINLEQYDAIILEGDKNQVLTFRKRYKKKIILHIHTVITFTKHTPFAKKIFRECDYILANSQFTQKTISEICPEQSDKVIEFANCIDVSEFISIDRYYWRSAIRKKHNLSDNDKVFIFCGRLEEGKGVKELVQAFSRLDSNYKLMIVGASWYSTDKKTPYTDGLIEITQSISSRIVFTGYVKHEDIAKYYSAADVCVVPSIYEEAACLVVLEAQAAGLPIVASNIGGIPEFVYPQNGALVDVDNDFVVNLSSAMEEMIQRKDNFNNNMEIDKFMNSHDVATYAEKFLTILSKIGRD